MPRTAKAPKPQPGEYEVGDMVEHVKPCPPYATGKFKVMEIRVNKKGLNETSVYGGNGYKNTTGQNTKGDGIYAAWRTFRTENLVKVK